MLQNFGDKCNIHHLAMPYGDRNNVQRVHILKHNARASIWYDISALCNRHVLHTQHGSARSGCKTTLDQCIAVCPKIVCAEHARHAVFALKEIR